MLISFSGCADKTKADMSEKRIKAMAGGELKNVVAIEGVVNVDGNPEAGVNLFLYREGNDNPIMECRTDEDGKYCWTTHTRCDGLEPGKYLIGFTYVPKPRKNGSGVDLFKGKYQDPRKSGFKLTVVADSPETDVDYDLKLK